MNGPTIEEINSLRESTGEGIMACKKILEQKCAEEEKQEMLAKIRELSFSDRKTERLVKELLTYLVRKA